jgi:hypothetical protein
MHAHVHHVCNALGGRYQHAMAVAHAPFVLQGGCRQCIMLHPCALHADNAVAAALTMPAFKGDCIHRTRMNTMSAKAWLLLQHVVTIWHASPVVEGGCRQHTLLPKQCSSPCLTSYASSLSELAAASGCSQSTTGSI